MSYLRLQGLTKRYGDQLAADDVTLDIEQGEMIVLLGPSGCGKTTTLRMIAGFVEASAGEIVLEGRPIGVLPPHRRAMGMVFQNYALFPHLTAAGNVAFGLEMQNMPRPARVARVAEMLQLVKLDRPLADRLAGEDAPPLALDPLDLDRIRLTERHTFNLPAEGTRAPLLALQWTRTGPRCRGAIDPEARGSPRPPRRLSCQGPDRG